MELTGTITTCSYASTSIYNYLNMQRKRTFDPEAPLFLGGLWPIQIKTKQKKKQYGFDQVINYLSNHETPLEVDE